jgi:tetratricopeptide (TPR) repeat protein
LLLAYSNSFKGDLSFDSATVVRDDPRIRTVAPQNLYAIWSTGYWFDNQDPSLYRPLTTLSYMVNYAVLGGGPRPAGYHWINFLLHCINAVLVYGLGLAVFRNAAQSAALASLWAVHPVLTESVTNIVGRADLLAGFGVLAGLLCHVKAASSAGRRRARWLVALFAASAAGIFSKESAVVLVALMLAYDLAFDTRALRACLPSYGVAILPVCLFLWQRWQVISRLPVIGTAFVNNPLLGAGFWGAKLTAIQVIGRYIALILWPSILSCDYSYHQISVFRGTFDNWGDWVTAAAAVVCVLAAGLLFLAFRRYRPVFFLGALFFVALAPVANIAMPIGTIMAERFLYLPAVGFLGCAVWALYAGADWWQKNSGAAISPIWMVGLVCLLLAARTYARNADWENSTALFTSAVAASPNSYRTHFNLALSLFRDQGNTDGAIAEGERSLAILRPLPLDRDEDVGPYSNVGAFYRVKGDMLAQGHPPDAAAANRLYQRSLEILLHGEAVDRARAAKLMRQNQAAGRPSTQFGVYQVYQEVGEIYLRVDEPGNALDAVEQAFSLQPSGELLEMMSEAYTALHDRDNAAIALMGGLLTQQDQTPFLSALAAIYRAGNSVCAIGSNGSLNFGCPPVHEHLCAGARRVGELFERGGRKSQAEEVRSRATATFGCPVP